MLSPTIPEGIKRLYDDYRDLCDNPLINFGCTVGLVNNDDLYKWRFTLLGARDTSYALGLFFLNIIFPKEYPNIRLEIVFLTPIYHPNVKWFKFKHNFDSLGHAYVSFLNF